MTKPSIFKDNKMPLDMCHVKAVLPFSQIDQEMFKKYYSPSAVSLSLVLEATEILKGFYGSHLIDKDNAKIFFPRETMDPILILYEVPMWEDDHWEDRRTAPYSMVIALAPRSRLPDEKTNQFPQLAELEIKESQNSESGGIK